MTSKSTDKNYKMKGAYLNYASTNAKKNGNFNYSDRVYPQVMEQREAISDLEVDIRKLVNAPANAKVIFNSGATESIATCVHWTKTYNQYSSMLGSPFDHSAVKDNCDLFELKYDQSLQKGINDKTGGIMLTHVNSKTGEIINVKNFITNMFSIYTFSYEQPTISENVMQYRPLLFLDATQSITKVPVDMERWGLDAVFFSLHKIGGPQGLGVLVVDDKSKSFKPLIAGKQQKSLRGGTLPLSQLVYNSDIFENKDDYNKRIDTWKHAVSRMEESGLKVYKPKGAHLYNTILIDIGHCPMPIINHLASKQIYVGNVSACQNEVEDTNDPDETNVKPFDKAIRISFSSPDELNDAIVDKIIKSIVK